MPSATSPEDYGYTREKDRRYLRACMVCSIVLLRDVSTKQTDMAYEGVVADQESQTFVLTGCPNCESFLGLQGSPETVSECTSSTFNGTIALTEPTKSWVAKWQRLDQYVPGVYAVQVIGNLPGDVIQMMEDAGHTYVPRDGTKEDDVGEE
jgi:transcription elongation factor SPT4